MIGKTDSELKAENSPGAELVGRDKIGIDAKDHERMLNARVAEVRADLEARFRAEMRATHLEVAFQKVVIRELRIQVEQANNNVKINSHWTSNND